MYEIYLPDHYKALYGVSTAGFEQPRNVNRRGLFGEQLWKQHAKTGVWTFMPVTLGDLELWNPIMRMTARKNVVETQMTELNGSVKEIISMEDWVINIRGWIKRSDGTYPSSELQELNSLYRKNQAVAIQSEMTSILIPGMEWVVITNISFPDKQGSVGAVPYELEMTSDTPFDLMIEDRN